MSGLREAVPIMYILTNGNDYTAEVEAMEAVQSCSDSERDVVRYIVKRLEAVVLSSAIYKNYKDHFWVVALGGGVIEVSSRNFEVFFFCWHQRRAKYTNSWILIPCISYCIISLTNQLYIMFMVFDYSWLLMLKFFKIMAGLNGEGWDPTFRALCLYSCAYFKSWCFGEQSSDFCIFWKPFTFKYKCKENEWKTRKTRLGHTSIPEVEDEVFMTEGEKTAIATAGAARAVALAKKGIARGTACIKSTFCAKVRPCSSIHCWCFSAMTTSCKAWFSMASICCCVYWIVKFWIV